MTLRNNFWRQLFAAIALGVTSFGTLYAQNNTGQIIGVVTDVQGAVIPNATVVAVNVDTGVSSPTVTNQRGAYQILDLPIGNYAIEISAPGFKKIRTEPSALNINQALRVDGSLVVGTQASTVEVNAAAVQVETVSSTVGATVSGAPIQNLPLNGRDTLSLALTQPGVAPVAGSSTTAPTFSIAGGRSNSQLYVMDGGVNNSVTANTVVYNPNPDAVAEFRILENNYSAEYGRNAGGVITVVTKSGSNDLHGTLFEFLRNDALNANDFFDNELGQPRPVLKRNQFGGTIGGPITIPHLVDGKNKLFFFFAYQGQRQSQKETEPAVTVYTPAEITGDFSHSVANRAGQLGPDPDVAAFLQAYPYYQPNAALAAQAMISPGSIDPVAAKYISTGLIPTSPLGAITPQGSAADNIEQYTSKVDWYASRRNRFSVTVGSNRETVVNPFSANVPGFIDGTDTLTQSINFDYTATISTAMLNDAHATAERSKAEEAPINKPATPASLGVGINADSIYGPPILDFASGMTVGFNPNTPRSKADDTYSVSDVLTWIRGNHALKFGGGVTELEENTIYSYNTDGAFDIDGYYPVASGNDLADFLLGAPDNFEQEAKAPNNEHQAQTGVFAQDDWKITPRLTLSFGLRYEYTQPETDTRGYSWDIIPGLTDTRFTNMPLGLVVPGDKGAPKGWYFPDRTDFGPRLGFAYDPMGDGKTSIRGGFGRFYDTINGMMSDWANGYLPWFSSVNLYYVPNEIVNGPNALFHNPYGTACPDPDPTSTFCQGPLGAVDPFPTKIPVQGTSLLAEGGTFPYGGSFTFVDPHLKVPYIYQYNLSIQRQLGNGLVAQIGYVGNGTHKGLAWQNLNPLIPGTGEGLLNIQTGANPNVNGYGPVMAFVGKSDGNYNGLLTSLTKSTGDVRGLGTMFFTISYTWSHDLDDASGTGTAQVPYANPGQFYSNSSYDLPQRFTYSGGWSPAFDRLWAGGPKQLTGGWNFYYVGYAQDGTPLDLYLHPAGGSPADPSEGDPGSSGYGDPELERPDQLVSHVQKLNLHKLQTLGGHTGNYFYNPTDFAPDPCIAAGTCPTGFYGTYQRDSLLGPGLSDIDISLEKVTTLEHVGITARAEAFNAVNNVQFENPATRYSSSTRGQSTSSYGPRILQLSLRLRF